MVKVALVGKPNVGKSSLFNRIIGIRKSIVDDEPGVTRDRIYAKTKWLNQPMELVDTGGLTNKNLSFQSNIQKQVNYAIEEANIILFIVSAKESINNEDYFVAKILKKYRAKHIILVVNKAENVSNTSNNESLYYSLGFGKPFYVSSSHGVGVGDLLDEVIKLKNDKSIGSDDNKTPFSFCVIGRTNVGKSTLVNTILNEDRVLVSEIPHTTRDSIDSSFKYNKEEFIIIDTAGIRRKGKITDNVEKHSVIRTEESIARSNLILFVLDGSDEFNEQDEVIGGLAYKANIPTIICVNKWDNVKKDEKTMNEKIKLIRTKFKFLSWAPIIFISAKENQRIKTLFDTIALIRKQLQIKVSTSLLNDVITKATIMNPPPHYKGGVFNFSYATQVQSQIPSFVIFGNDPKYIHLSYMRYIENQIRKSFGIDITPITVYYKDKNARIRGIE